jgi:hypothetical protein
MYLAKGHLVTAPLLAVALMLSACSGDRGVTSPIESEVASANKAGGGNEPPPPSGLVSLTFPGGSSHLWPFTGTNFSGIPLDPINLIFTGAADPRQIRAALMSVSGAGRPGPLVAFSCEWEDAVGAPQTHFGDSDGWVGSAIQLECGPYVGLRFHLRLFRQGSFTVGNAHYETVIPGTNLHEVLSWELAELFVATDLARSGHLAATTQTGVITPAPLYRTVRKEVVAGLAPEQIAGLGLVVNADGSASIPNDGRATVLHIGTAPALEPGLAVKEFAIPFGQVIPKPFCAEGTTGYVYVTGSVPVRMVSGIVGQNYRSEWTVEASLTLIPFNPLTMQPAGEPYQAEVSMRNVTSVNTGMSAVEYFVLQRELPDVGPTRGSLREYLRAVEHGRDVYQLDVDC